MGNDRSIGRIGSPLKGRSIRSGVLRPGLWIVIAIPFGYPRSVPSIAMERWSGPLHEGSSVRSTGLRRAYLGLGWAGWAVASEGGGDGNTAPRSAAGRPMQSHKTARITQEQQSLAS